MTIKETYSYINELIIISKEEYKDNTANKALFLLNQDASTHNITLIKEFIDSVIGEH